MRQAPCICKKKVKVKLADGKERTIQHMMMHHFLASRRHTHVRAAVHGNALRQAAGVLQGRGRASDHLERPRYAKKLLQGLAEKGFGHEQLVEMQKIIDAEKSDLFDVLAHVAYALPPLTREERAVNAKVVITTHFNTKQQVFLDFVLSHYVSVGVEELDQEKLTPLLRLKYHNSISDAVADLGRPDEIGRVFTGFQKYLYQREAAA